MVNFVDEKMRITMRIEIVNDINWPVVGKENVIKCKVNGLVTASPKCFLDVLKNQSRLASPFWTLNARHLLLPINSTGHISPKNA